MRTVGPLVDVRTVKDRLAALMLDTHPRNMVCQIKTLENWVDLKPGCWVVGPGAAGEYWPVQHAIFMRTYRLARKPKAAKRTK